MTDQWIEQIPKFTATPTCQALHAKAGYAADLIKEICDTVGPGLPGTSQERSRALMIQQALETHLGPENVTVEEFYFAPGSFLGFQRFGSLFTLFAAVLNLAAGSTFLRFPRVSAAAALAATALSILSLLLFLFQFVLAHEVIDPWFKQATSVNVIGSLRAPGTQTVKRLLMVSGHHDSAWEDNLLHWLGYGFFAAVAVLFLGMLILPVASMLQLAGAAAGSAALVRLGTLGWAPLVLLILPSILFGVFWHRAGKNGGLVPGAVDNLSASALAVAMCAFLVEHPDLIPADTEVRFISFGSEETGLRGARRYVDRHLAELKNVDARLLNYEMVAYPEITITTSDRNGTLQNHPAMVESIRAAAQRAGVLHKAQPASFGTCTDAVPFTEAGLKALTLVPFQFPQQMVGFYHQRTDTPDKVTIEPLENVLKLTLAWIRCGGE